MDIQGPKWSTFYITSTSPSFSTPKPVRFIDVVTDKQLAKVDRANLTWSLCFDYPVRPNKNYIYICLLDLLTGFILC